jgi:hypothetical protein
VTVTPSAGRALVRGAIVAACLAGVGCASDQQKPQGDPVSGGGAQRSLPEIQAVLAGYNRRAASIPRLWASIVTVVEYTQDASGTPREQTEQFEGYFQFIAPRKVALTFDKLGDTYAALGSDDTRYWWLQAGDDPRAYVGTRNELGAADGAGVKALGVPISPDDLTRLLGLQPLETASPVYQLAWAPGANRLMLTRDRLVDGLVVGQERITIDPTTYEPVRVELEILHGTRVDPARTGAGEGGPQKFTAELTKYAPAEVRGIKLADGPPRIPERAELSLWNGSTRVRMSLFSAEISPNKPSERVFDLAFMLRVLKLDPAKVESIDGARAATRAEARSGMSPGDGTERPAGNEPK